MANFVFNIALGRVAELYNRVDSNDPANSVLTMIAWNAADSDATGSLNRSVKKSSGRWSATSCAPLVIRIGLRNRGASAPRSKSSVWIDTRCTAAPNRP